MTAPGSDCGEASIVKTSCFFPQGFPGCSALHLAATSGSLETVGFLLQSGTAVDVEDDVSEQALSVTFACRFRRRSVPNRSRIICSPSQEGSTPLFYAAVAGQLLTVQALIRQHKADACHLNKARARNSLLARPLFGAPLSLTLSARGPFVTDGRLGGVLRGKEHLLW